MTTFSLDLLKQEWENLHQDHERYDRYGLLIKLTAALACLLSIAMGMTLWLALMFVLVLWLQEGIWRTVQARTSERLLVVEKALKKSASENNDVQGMQFYSEWEANRPGTVGLVKEYILNAVRPTVAYPYVILIALNVLVSVFGLI
ncbi:hypothetical protein ACFL2V_01945 [Pseudomonadota bacterium]